MKKKGGEKKAAPKARDKAKNDGRVLLSKREEACTNAALGRKKHTKSRTKE